MIENAHILANYKDNIKDVLTPVLGNLSAEQFKDAPKNITYITRLDKPLQLDEITALTNNDKIAVEIKNNLKNKQQITKTSDLSENINILKKM